MQPNTNLPAIVSWLVEPFCAPSYQVQVGSPDSKDVDSSRKLPDPYVLEKPSSSAPQSVVAVLGDAQPVVGEEFAAKCRFRLPRHLL